MGKVLPGGKGWGGWVKCYRGEGVGRMGKVGEGD